MTSNIISLQVASMGNQLMQQQSPSRPNNLVSSLQQPVSPAQLGQTQSVMMQQPAPKIVTTTIHQPQFSTQVWPLIIHQYSADFFLVKNHRFAFMANQWPLVQENFFPSYSLLNSLNSVFGPVRDSWAEGALQGWCNISSYVASRTAEIRGHCYAWCPGGSRTLLTQWMQTLNVSLWEHTISYCRYWL